MFEKVNIFEKDETHPSCHASFIHEIVPGELMAIWYAGKAEAHKSVCIKASRKKIESKINDWSKPVIIHKTPNKADGNAILVSYGQKLFLFHNVIQGFLFPWSTVSLQYKISDDNGYNWSESRVILGDRRKTRGYTVRNKAVILDNRMIIPTGRERITKSTCQMLISDDGVNFELSEEIKLDNGKCLQPTILKKGGQKIIAFLRTSTNYVYRTESGDGGFSWDVPEKLSINNPNSALDAVITDQGEIIMVWNNTMREGGTMRSRKVLHVGYSKDGGRTWPIIKEIERNDKDGRFAYPSIIIGSDGLFHLTYTNRRRTIRYVKFDKKWLLS